MATLSPEKQRLLEQRLKGLPHSEKKRLIPKRSSGDLAPLSCAQRQIWWINHLSPGCPAYNLPIGYRLQGLLDLKALEESLNAVVRRHESLRTTFTLANGHPVQSVQPPPRLEVAVVRFDELDSSEREQKLHEFASAEALRPFDLARLPLLRASVCRLSETEHVFILVVHHIVADGLSVGILMKEVDSLYRAFTHLPSDSLPDLAVQYSDFCFWESELIAEKIHAHQLEYWENQLHGQLPVLDLASAKARPPVQSFAGGNVFFKLSEPLTRDLSRLGRDQGCSFFMTVFTAFQIFLHRYGGVEDLVIGSPIAVRNAREVEPLIGNFVNMLALRCDLSGDPTVSELLRRTKETALQAYSHKDVPFAQLIERLRFERDTRRNPIFQTILQVLPANEVKLGNLEIAPYHFDFKFAQFDLALHLYEEEGGYFGRFEYCSDLYEASAVERWSRNFQELLQGMVRNSDRRISEIGVLAEDESHRLLVEWNQTRFDFPRDQCLHQLFEATVERTPDAVAVEFEGERLTYRELNRLADSLAAQLRSVGVMADIMVPVCLERCLAMAVGVLGILKAGGAYLPLDPSHPRERLAFMLADCGARVVVTQASLDHLFSNAGAKMIHLQSDGKVVGDPVPVVATSSAGADNLAYVIYTSGSTGKPKGVQICHRSVVNLLLSMVPELELTSKDIVLAVTTLSFDIATAELFLPLILGARLVIVSRAVAGDGQRLAALLDSSGATFLQPTPATWRLLLAAGWKGNSQLKMVSTGEELPGDLAAQLLPKGAALWNLYGPTETTIWSTASRLRSVSGAISIGRPLGNTQVYIVDRHLQPVPIGAVGELCIAGDGLARGYLNRPDLTAERFITNPFDPTQGSRLYRTSDLARYREDGTIDCLGRMDHQVKVRGFRIELGEIEAVLRTHAQVAGVVVVAVKSESSGEKVLVAYIAGKGHLPITAAMLRAFLKTSLPEYMIPTGFVFLDALPLTSSGKVNRPALPPWSPAQRVGASNLIAPRTPIELELMRIWERIFNLPSIGVTDSFFDLGGHSLLAVRLVGEISESLDCDVRVLMLFQNPTIEQLARAIPENRPAKREPVLFTLRSEGSETPLFFTGAGIWEFSLAGLLRKSRPVFAMDVPLSLNVLRAAAESNPAPFPTVEEWAAQYTTLIRRQLPSGPCLLAGHCFQGLLAYEVAHQLTAAGVEVEGVFLLDTRIKATLRWRRLKLWLRKHSQNTLDHGLAYLRRKTRTKLRRVSRKLKTQIDLAGKNDPSLTFDESNSQVNWAITERVILHAARRYKLRPLSLPGVLFLAEEGATEFYEDDGPFRASHLFPAGLEIAVVPGGHVSIFEEPHLQELGERFQHFLDKI